MKEELIEQKFKEHDEHFERVDEKDKEQDKKIFQLDKENEVNKTNIKNVCDRISNLTSALWGLTSILLTGIVLYIIQKIIG